jgi:cathepsin L
MWKGRVAIVAALAFALLLLFRQEGEAFRPDDKKDTKKDTKSPTKVGPKSEKEITAKLNTLRQQVKANKKYTFTVGRTQAMTHRLARLCGGKMPADEKQRRKARAKVAEQVHKAVLEAQQKFLKSTKGARALGNWWDILNYLYPDGLPRHFDWVDLGKVTHVKDQSDCGSCWDFCAIAAFEASYAIRNGMMIDASEQQILDCARAGSCCGGWHTPVFDYLIQHGTAYTNQYDFYRPGQACCNTGASTPLRAVNWGYVNPNVDIPSVSEIKHALVTHGPLSVAVNATGLFQGYTGGVFNEHNTGGINHCVLITGWDENKKAWHIKNSWSTNWGEKGYMWIAYDSNKIGTSAAWVTAHCIYLPFPWGKVAKVAKVTKELPPPVPFKPGSIAPPKAPAKSKTKDKDK